MLDICYLIPLYLAYEGLLALLAIYSSQSGICTHFMIEPLDCVSIVPLVSKLTYVD
jgi:hypothetical protein